MTYYEWLEFAWRYYTKEENKYLRKGQTLVNALLKVHPDLGLKISGTPIDPTYRDDRISDFLTLVKKRWDE